MGLEPRSHGSRARALSPPRFAAFTQPGPAVILGLASALPALVAAHGGPSVLKNVKSCDVNILINSHVGCFLKYCNSSVQKMSKNPSKLADAGDCEMQRCYFHSLVAPGELASPVGITVLLPCFGNSVSPLRVSSCYQTELL